jgi:hypothetical protein
MHFRAVYNAIRGVPGRRLFADVNDGHQEVAVCEAIAESDRNEAWVKVPVLRKNQASGGSK